MPDIQLQTKVEAMRMALILSVTDPVAVQDVSGYVFYDCCEDEEEGETIVKRRIEIAGEDIRKSFDFHKQAIPIFYEVEEAGNGHHRERYVSAVESLVSSGRGYIEVVRDHRRRLGEDSFLAYPFTNHEHYSVVGRNIVKLVFNPTQDYKGFLGEMELLKSLTSDFRFGESIPKIIRGGSRDEGEGYDTSLRGRVELTNELLRRVGMEL